MWSMKSPSILISYSIKDCKKYTVLVNYLHNFKWRQQKNFLLDEKSNLIWLERRASIKSRIYYHIIIFYSQFTYFNNRKDNIRAFLLFIRTQFMKIIGINTCIQSLVEELIFHHFPPPHTPTEKKIPTDGEVFFPIFCCFRKKG